jgi:DNA polymerase III alpha subunit
MSTIPLFYDHFSSKSILTCWDTKDCTEGGPDSIISLAKSANLKDVYLVSPNFHPFIEGMKACDKEGITFHFGLELWVCPNAEDLSEQSKNNESKVIIWAKNSESYKDLVRLYTAYASNPNYFYHHSRFDWKGLQAYWTPNLMLTIPFWDSFLARNTLNYDTQIIPQFPVDPILFVENETEHPHEGLIKSAITRFNAENKYETQDVKTIYYAKESDIPAYINYRAIHNRSSFDKPEINMMASPTFSFESWARIEGVKVQ